MSTPITAPAGRVQSPSSGRRPLLIAFSAYSVLAVALTWPLVLHLSSVVPHDNGDPMLTTAILWWNAHVVPFTERWWNGFAFYPAPGFLAFSDPRVGESLLATPLQWLGLDPVSAYNLTFLVTYPLSAIAAHWLGFVLTGRHDAAAIAGVVFGFCPFRGAHTAHLELLAAFGMPAALVALHRFYDTGRRGWLVLLAAAIFIQGLCSSYYLVFFAVLMAAWLLWFTRRADLTRVPQVALAALCGVVLLVPLAMGYSRIHAYYGLHRSFGEILLYSADATALFAADQIMLLWGWTGRWGVREGLLFPGATISLLVIACGAVAWRRTRERDLLDRASRWVLVAAIACAAVAGAGWAFAPWRIDIPGLTMSSESSYKTMTIALLLAACWLAMSTPLRRAYAHRSAFAFYVMAAALLFLCSFGPKPTFFGHQFLYEPPYAWLMHIPVFDSIRAPARFGMPAMLALGLAGAVGFDHLRLGRTRRLVAGVLLAGITADGWIAPMPLAPIPDMWPAARADGFTAVMELPLGDTFPDLHATYRAIRHGRPVINGSSGFEPIHYFALRTAIEERDPSAFDWWSGPGRVLAVVDRQRTDFAEWDGFLAGHPRVTRLAPDQRWAFYAIAPVDLTTTSCDGPRAPIQSVSFSDAPSDTAALLDDDVTTVWSTPKSQRPGDALLLDLGGPRPVCGVVLEIGEFRSGYPRKLIVDTSPDGTVWDAALDTRTAGLTIRAALDRPRTVDVPLSFSTRPARFVRLRLDQADADAPWQMAGVAVTTPAAR